VARAAEARAAFLRPYKVETGEGFLLAGHETAVRDGMDKAQGLKRLRARSKRLAELQENLYAEGRRGVVVVLQGMDTAGKDGVISHVMADLSQQGVVVTAFKQPNTIELAHDFLWRIHQHVPERGRIGIFNRSHYEDVMVLRVHPERIRAGDVAGDPRSDAFWQDRYTDIRHFESYLARQNITVLKFLLHISPEAQRERLVSRLEQPDKRWKYDPNDLKERGCWPDYQHVFEEAIAHTAQPCAPWFVVPSDHKWFSRLVVMEAMIDHLEKLDPHPPKPDPKVMSALDEALAALRA
jgi:PPK2 family polyphosphate:nucleotide phosphotransferase